MTFSALHHHILSPADLWKLSLEIGDKRQPDGSLGSYADFYLTYIAYRAVLYYVSLSRLDYSVSRVVSTCVDSSLLDDIFYPPLPPPHCLRDIIILNFALSTRLFHKLSRVNLCQLVASYLYFLFIHLPHSMLCVTSSNYRLRYNVRRLQLVLFFTTYIPVSRVDYKIGRLK